MADAPDRPDQLPPQKISVSDSANAPIVFFDGVPNFGNYHGVMNITLAANRNLLKDSEIVTDFVVVAFLRCSIQAALELRNAIDQALLLGAPTEGKAN